MIYLLNKKQLLIGTQNTAAEWSGPARAKEKACCTEEKKKKHLSTSMPA
jgi:hypothetical protein